MGKNIEEKRHGYRNKTLLQKLKSGWKIMLLLQQLDILTTPKFLQSKSSLNLSVLFL